MLLIAGPEQIPPSGPTVGDHRTVELVDLGGTPARDLLTRVAAEAATAVEAVERFWGTDWTHHIVVVATGTAEQFAQSAHAPLDTGTAAVTVADTIDPQRGLATGQRIVLAPGAVTMSSHALRIVLAHELFHYASRADTAVDAPRWLTEGVADFVARHDTAMPAAAALPLALPSDSDLDAAEPQRSLAYDRAWWFARFVADDYGAGVLRQLYRVACGVGHVDPATAVSLVLGAEFSDVLARWQQWATR